MITIRRAKHGLWESRYNGHLPCIATDPDWLLVLAWERYGKNVPAIIHFGPPP